MTPETDRLPGRHEGSGPPLLLVHGLGTCWQTWAPTLSRLTRHHEVSAVDLPGSAGTPPLEDPTVAAFADALEAHLDALGWQRCHLAGNSLGGLLALELARRQRALTTTLFAPLGMAVGWEDAWWRGVFRVTFGLAGALGPWWVALSGRSSVRTPPLHLMVSRPRQLDETLATTVASSFARASCGRTVLERLDEETTIARLEEVSCPVTIAWGTRDRILVPRQGPRFRRAMPHARLVRLPGLGHVPMLDGPELCTEVVLATVAT